MKERVWCAYEILTRVHLPYFCSSSERSIGERLYPKLRRASESSDPSIDPEWSLSKCLKTFCQSWMYFHSPANSGTDPLAHRTRLRLAPPGRQAGDDVSDLPLNPIVPLRSVSCETF